MTIEKDHHELLVVRKLMLVEKETGTTKLIDIKLGYPYWIEKDIKAVCQIFIDELLHKTINIYGGDLLEALNLSVKFIDRYLRDRPELFWPTGEPYEVA